MTTGIGTALVTGATEGIGLATATALARAGFRVAIVGRNPRKGEEAVQAIRTAAGTQEAHFLAADVSSMHVVRDLAARVTQQFPDLRALVNNAGGLFLERTTTAEGFEATFALNHLAPFVLTEALLPVLRANGPARVVNISTGLHRMAKLKIDDLQLTNEKYDTNRVYGHSKLIGVIATQAWARRLANTGIAINIADPGGAATSMNRTFMANPSMPKLLRLISPVLSRFMTLTTDEAARSSVFLASAPEAAELQGAYITPKLANKRAARAAYDIGLQDRVWDQTVRMLADIDIKLA